jgi:hypothetical protein
VYANFCENIYVLQGLGGVNAGQPLLDLFGELCRLANGFANLSYGNCHVGLST